MRQKLAEVIELAPQLLDLSLDALDADGVSVDEVPPAACAAIHLAPDDEGLVRALAPERDLAPALLLASLDELGHLVRPAQDLGGRGESHGQGAHERRLTGAVRAEDDVKPRAGFHLHVGVGHEVVQPHLHHGAGLVLGGVMARPRARALSVTVRVHRGGVDGLILVEVEVLGAALDEYRHDGLFNSWKTPLSVRPLLRCAELSATVQKIVQAPSRIPPVPRFPSGVPAPSAMGK